MGYSQCAMGYKRFLEAERVRQENLPRPTLNSASSGAGRRFGAFGFR
jgi:hypothetical protein